MEFKERLRMLRKEFGFTQEELAKKLNYGYTAISNYESGRNEPSINDLKKIASCFQVSMDYLLCVSDIRNPYHPSTLPAEATLLLAHWAKLEPAQQEVLVQLSTWLSENNSQNERKGSKLKVAQKRTAYKTANTILDESETD